MSWPQSGNCTDLLSHHTNVEGGPIRTALFVLGVLMKWAISKGQTKSWFSMCDPV